MTRKTAGELSLKASQDTTKYDSLEVGHALTDGIMEHLIECAEKHRNIIDEDEFCVVFIIADDPVVKNVMRRKFYAWPFLPKPRPRQACFLYNKAKETMKRLWVLPEAFAMSALSEMVTVGKGWETMKGWSDAFYSGKFFEHIRDQHNITMLAEYEYLEANSEKLIQAGCKKSESKFTDPLDLEKIFVKEVINSKKAVAE